VSTSQILLLGAVAGSTIFVGLPVGRLQGSSTALKAALSSAATGILLFLLYDVLQHGVSPVDSSLTAAVHNRGSWGDFSWKGWWGDSPPYHVPVFVLTHHPRPPLEMQGGTTFHFVTDGIEAALARAREAAAGRDVRIGGGVSTIRQYLRAGLIDELHLVQSAVLLGRGESLLHDIDLRAQGFETVRRVPGDHGMHVVLARHAR